MEIFGTLVQGSLRRGVISIARGGGVLLLKAPWSRAYYSERKRNDFLFRVWGWRAYVNPRGV